MVPVPITAVLKINVSFWTKEKIQLQMPDSDPSCMVLYKKECWQGYKATAAKGQCLLPDRSFLFLFCHFLALQIYDFVMKCLAGAGTLRILDCRIMAC